MKKQCIIFAIILGLTTAKSQNPYWRPAGNAGAGLDLVTPANNFLGTSLGNPVSIRFITNGATNMTLQNGTGFLGIGIAAPAFNLDVQDNANLNINYNANPGFGYRINGDKLLSHPGIRNTFVGKNAGAAWVGPNLFQSCTFVGEDAGPVSTGDGNTFVGDRAGLNNTTGDFNTFLGSLCGQNNTTGEFNTFLGHHAGLNNTTGNGNTFVGYHTVGGSGATTGDNNTVVGVISTVNLTSGTNNCMFGRSSGRFTQTGSANCFYGPNSGFSNTSGNNNVFMGVSAGSINQTGSNNVILGRLANMLAGQINLNNAIAIGQQAIVSDNNKMILGDNTINVGIGLSNSAVGNGPQKKLEIKETAVASPTSSNPTIPGTSGGSGLRFRNLTSATPTTASIGKVLTVNANGDVILVADQTSSVAPGSVFAQNGLTLVGTNTVELGGTLLHNTAINFSTSILQYTDPTTLHYQREPNGAVYQLATGAVGVGQPAGFSDFAFITNTSGGVGKLMQTFPISSFASAGAGLVGEEFLTYGTPTTGVGGINGNVTGIISIAQNTASTIGSNIAINALAQGASPTNNSAINVGVLSSATGGQNNYGFYSIIQGAMPIAIEDNGVRVYARSNNATTTNIGGNFDVGNGQNVYGLKVFAQNGSATNYGVYVNAATTSSAIPNYAIYSQAPAYGGTTTLSYAGYFNGNVVRTGADNFTSDQNLKQNIDTITNAIGIIKQLKPKTFDYKQSSYPSMSLPGGKQYGLIAQDVSPILPELVNNITHPAKLDSLGNVIIPSFTYLSLEYQQLTAIMIRAMQQQERRAEKQDSTIQAMQSQIAALTSSVSSCCSSSLVRTTKPNELNQLDVNLSDKDIVVLNQNVPNPFAEQTTITYNVPEKYNFAQIIFSTVEGKIIKTVDITKKGKGQLNVFANDLGTGFYTYTLIVDGKTIDTKKMVKSE